MPIPTALATATDYTNYWPGQTAPSDQVLRSCSQLVLDATKLSNYYTNTDGTPSDPIVAATMRDATCIQAAAWVALNIDPLTGGAMTTSKIAQSKKIGSAAITYDAAETAEVVAARKAAYTGLVPDAARLLRLNNLLSFAPRRARSW